MCVAHAILLKKYELNFLVFAGISDPCLIRSDRYRIPAEQSFTKDCSFSDVLDMQV